jgi:hypothetical protein
MTFWIDEVAICIRFLYYKREGDDLLKTDTNYCEFKYLLFTSERQQSEQKHLLMDDCIPRKPSET